MWHTVLLCKEFYLLVLFLFLGYFQPKFSRYVPVVVILTLYIPQWFPFIHQRNQFLSINHFLIKKRKQGIDVLSTKLHDTLAYTAGKKMIWFRPSVGETRPCTSVQHGATETVSIYFNAFVCSAVVGLVRQCKKSAKNGCSVTIA
jgi:hypothetical protein